MIKTISHFIAGAVLLVGLGCSSSNKSATTNATATEACKSECKEACKESCKEACPEAVKKVNASVTSDCQMKKACEGMKKDCEGMKKCEEKANPN